MKRMSDLLKQLNEASKKSAISSAHHPKMGHYHIKKLSNRHYALYDKHGDLRLSVFSNSEHGAVEQLRQRGYHVS